MCGRGGHFSLQKSFKSEISTRLIMAVTLNMKNCMFFKVLHPPHDPGISLRRPFVFLNIFSL